jgi:uncharacterized protein YlaI
MNVICILCDQSFRPNPHQEKKLKKHPHKIQLCFNCYERIKTQVNNRQKRKFYKQS